MAMVAYAPADVNLTGEDRNPLRCAEAVFGERASTAHALDTREGRPNQRLHPPVDGVAHLAVVRGQPQDGAVVLAEDIGAAGALQGGKEPLFLENLPDRLRAVPAFQPLDPMPVALDPPLANSTERGAQRGRGFPLERVEHGGGKRVVRLRERAVRQPGGLVESARASLAPAEAAARHQARRLQGGEMA